ncbi:MAG: lysyl oxidase family protein [Bacteroidota bacterium]|nr:lysyl oxidase family protein [Bacteroidota bacterium]
MNCKFFFLIIALFYVGQITAQNKHEVQRITTRGGQIPDNDATYRPYIIAVQVSGLPDKIDARFGLERVCLNITHDRISDLKIELISPDSTSIWVTNRNGGDNGKNYLETCFADNGFSGHLYENKAPYVGTYIPDGKINDFNNNQNPNGTWYLVVQDLLIDVEGTIDYVHLDFGNQPPKEAYTPCNTNNPTACACPKRKSKKCELLPDLIIGARMTEIQFQEYSTTDKYYPRQVRLAVATPNIGFGPLETQGTGNWICDGKPVDGPIRCPNGQNARQYLDQIIYYKKKGKISTYRKRAGTNYFDSSRGHNHFHADDWIEITLRNKIEGEPDARKWPVLSIGHKVSYCLFDSGNCTDENQMCQDGDNGYKSVQNLPNYGFGHYIKCESNLQGISVGGIDHYGQSFEGQYVTIPENTCNGQYYLVVEVDPTNKFKESDETNNVFVMPIKLQLQQICTEK